MSTHRSDVNAECCTILQNGHPFPQVMSLEAELCAQKYTD